jgi:hypothetical protein
MKRSQGSAVRALAGVAALALGGGIPARASSTSGRSPEAEHAVPAGTGIVFGGEKEGVWSGASLIPPPGTAGVRSAGLAASSASGSVGGVSAFSGGVSNTPNSNQVVDDPYFADAVSAGIEVGVDPYWSQYSTADYYTITTAYEVETGWSSGYGDYTSDLCGYEFCDYDEVYQQIIVPQGITSATLSYDLAEACATGACNGGSAMEVGFFNPGTDGYAFDLWTDYVPSGEVNAEPTAEHDTSANLLTWLQDNAGDVVDVLMEADTPSGDGSEFFVTGTSLTINGSPPAPPTNVSAVDTASGEATLSWTPPAGAAGEGVTGYWVFIYNYLSQPIGRAFVSGSSTTSTLVTGLTNGTPWFFAVASGNGSMTSSFVPSNSVTPLSGAAPSAGETAVSTLQYQLPNSDGSTWQVMDETNLAFTMSPSVTENVLLSANADLWTSSTGYNQDIGILVTPGTGTPVLAAWKESGGFAGTYSPNAAFVQTVYAMTGGTTYTVQVVWKTNKAAIGATIAAAAGAGPAFSPTRLTADVLPTGSQTAVSMEQYTLPNSNGSTWTPMDATTLKVTLSPSISEDAVVSGNSDLWTQNAGYNQDIGIFVSVNGGTAALVAWKESGGFAGTFSPNAAFVQTVYPMTGGDTYVFSLEWKTNKPAAATIIDAGAGSFPSYSPTRLTAYPLASASVATALSTQQYLLPNSDGSTWSPMDSTNLVLTVTGAAETVLVSGNSDLWTKNAGYNQDIGIFVSEDSGPGTLLAWKESGGFAGTYSPNAAFVQTVYTMLSGHSYMFYLAWKTNVAASGATIEAAAGSGPAFSPTRLTVVPQT